MVFSQNRDEFSKQLTGYARLVPNAIATVTLSNAHMTKPHHLYPSLTFISFGLSLGSQVMRADIQRKPLGFQEVTAPKYRCVAFCVVDLI